MIADNTTNTIYLSELLKSDIRFAKTCEELTTIFDSIEVAYKFLPNTHDIWARDYMPVQITKEKFIEYRYDPDYLQGKTYRKLKTYPDIVCQSIGIKTVKTNIILDGGNIIKSSNSVILTDKVIIENRDFYSEKSLELELKVLFEVDNVIFIPWDKKNDYLGHSDGMLRFIDDNTVLINHYFETYPKEFQDRFFGALKNSGIDWITLKYDVKKEDDRNWAYINYLQTKDVIVLPQFQIEEDNQALLQMKKLFPEYAIYQVDMTNVVKEGGALNCISWTTKE